MKNLLRTGLALLLISLAACIKSNFPPTVVKIVATSTIIEVEQEIEVTCLAHDFDGDSLIYSWSSPSGIFRQGSNNQTVTWASPAQVGSYEISVTVSDGTDSGSGSLNINVVPAVDSGRFVDERDGMDYAYATIGTQIWMTGNLAWLPMVHAPDTGSQDSAFYYVADFFEDGATALAKESQQYHDYGVLYNYTASLQACPSGWHLPSDEEWDLLVEFLGEDPGYQMKSLESWNTMGGGDNSSRFNAVPGGYRYFAGRFGGSGNYAFFWSATTTQSGDPNRYYLSYKSDQILEGPTQYHDYGYSVRCIKNE